MKKYLIKGLLAFIVGAFVASCVNDKVEYVPMAQQKATAYSEAFKELIGGEVAPNHDWGFTKTSLIEEPSAARTRAIDVNGNMWEDTPECTAAEAKLVFDYVNMTRAEMTAAGHKYANPFPENIENYYVTQVYTGTDTYSTSDQTTTGILGSSKMDHLCIAMKSDAQLDNGILKGAASSWEHINNFNASSNMNWGGNSLVVNGGTRDFVYNCSEDSRYHNKWIAVKGDDIDASLRGKYYICFDFEATLNSYTPLTGGKFYNPHSPNSDKWENINGINDIKIPGQWTNETVRNSGYTMEYTYSYWEDGVQKWDTITLDFSDENSVKDINCANYVGGNQEIIPNDVYTDWIVRIVPAQPQGGSSSSNTRTDRIERSRLVSQGRIFCEDLGTDATRMTTSDIDFNDAVFDAKIWRKGQFDVEYLNNTYNGESDYLEGIYQDGINATGIDYNVTTEDVIVNGKFKYVAEICILAAGGTVPLKIGGDGAGSFEIHDKFGVGHTTIVNTMGAPSQQQFTTTVQTATCEKKTIEVDITNLVKAELEAGNTDIGLEIIPIEVQWTSGNYQGVTVLEATSEDDIRNAPQKLCVPIGTPWVYERIPITSAYKDFASYAINKSPLFWNGNMNESLLYNMEGLTAEDNETGNIGSNPTRDVVVEEGDTYTMTETETIIWQGTNTYENDEDGSNGSQMNLWSHSFSEKDWIRVYGTPTDASQAIIELKNESWNSIYSFNPASFSEGTGYVEVQVDSAILTALSPNVMQSWGRYCTITKICKVVKTTTVNSN